MTFWKEEHVTAKSFMVSPSAARSWLSAMFHIRRPCPMLAVRPRKSHTADCERRHVTCNPGGEGDDSLLLPSEYYSSAKTTTDNYHHDIHGVLRTSFYIGTDCLSLLERNYSSS